MAARRGARGMSKRVMGIRSREEAITLAGRHVSDGDPKGYGYDHCAWCEDEWPCVTGALLEIVKGA